jgi:hypothetical protein
VIRFRSARRGRVQLRVVQIAPLCRPAGLISMRVHRGVNRLRFNGKLGRGWLVDGTYMLLTPTKPVRFAIVGGRPTRKPQRLQPSVCSDDGLASTLFGARLPFGPDATGLLPTTGEATGTEVADTAPSGGMLRPPKNMPNPTKVLGATVDEVTDTVGRLHPAFYVLLLASIFVLGVATMPASAVPGPWLGATLARRRPELTFVGISMLVTAVVAYLLSVGI